MTSWIRWHNDGTGRRGWTAWHAIDHGNCIPEGRVKCGRAVLPELGAVEAFQWEKRAEIAMGQVTCCTRCRAMVRSSMQKH